MDTHTHTSRNKAGSWEDNSMTTHAQAHAVIYMFNRSDEVQSLFIRCSPNFIYCIYDSESIVSRGAPWSKTICDTWISAVRARLVVRSGQHVLQEPVVPLRFHGKRSRGRHKHIRRLEANRQSRPSPVCQPDALALSFFLSRSLLPLVYDGFFITVVPCWL